MATRLEVPDDQKHLPRASRQFPYRAADDGERDEVRRELNDVLIGVDRMIFRTIRQVAPWASRELQEDWSQVIALHLAVYSLPKYDSWKEPKAKVSTFCQHCIRMKLAEILRPFRRRLAKRRARPLTLEMASPEELRDVDRSLDRAVERIADDVLADPTILGRLGPAHVGEGREMSINDLAERYGVRPATISSSRLRCREKVIEMLADAA